MISHYYFLRKFYSNTDPKFLKKWPYFNDLKDDTVNDVIKIWKAASLFVIGSIKIQTKLKNIISKFEAVKEQKLKKAVKLTKNGWMICSIYVNARVKLQKIPKRLTESLHAIVRGKIAFWKSKGHFLLIREAWENWWASYGREIVSCRCISHCPNSF